MKLISILTGVAISTLTATGARSQTTWPASPVSNIRPVQTNLTVTAGSGTGVVAATSTPKAGTSRIYDNTLANGWFSKSTPAVGEMFLDWGLLTAADHPDAKTHHDIVHLDLGYATTLATGATQGLDFYFYHHSTGWCSAGGSGTRVLELRVDGLPGSHPGDGVTGWTFSIPLENLTGPGDSFDIETMQGPIGYGYDFVDDQHTGALTVGQPNPTGVWDAFDFYDSNGYTCSGTYWFGGASSNTPQASFYAGFWGWKGYENFAPTATCSTSCGGNWSLNGSGTLADGDSFTITATNSVPYPTPTAHTALLYYELAPPSFKWYWGTGCSQDVFGCLFCFVWLGGASTPLSYSFDIPLGTPPPAVVSFQLLVNDSGDPACVTGPWGKVTSDVLTIYPY